MMRVSRWRSLCGVFLFCVVAAVASQAQVTLTTLASFAGPDGYYPIMALTQGSDGNFYGTTYYGGTSCGYRGGNGCGTVFKITRNGKLTRLYSFCHVSQCADGDQPEASLVQATNGKFYGTTLSGGSGPDGCGTVFEITAEGKLTTLHTFDGNDGCGPLAGLIQAANGNFYGTTYVGGMHGGGTVFEITTTGKFTSLHSFCSLPNCADGARPESSLAQGADGYFYGTTGAGGMSYNNAPCSTTGCGTVFRITGTGGLTTLYNFCALANCADGSNPSAALVQATNGNFYGVTPDGGRNCVTDSGCGTVFKVTPQGKLTSLYSFCSLTNCADGRSSLAPLIQGTDENFYGTTFGGGTGFGTLFEITPAGTLTTLYSMCSTANCSDGDLPSGALLQSTDGNFYGTTSEGGPGGDGTIFSLDTGLAPFVSFIRNPAKVGQQFGILGYGLTGTTSVSFNGVAAKFKLQSDTLLVATVPAGATTAYVTVTTPSATLTSNVPFHVIR